MKDRCSLSADERFFDPDSVTASVDVGILDIGRDIDDNFVRKKTFDLTLWSINQCIGRSICNYVGYHHSVHRILANCESDVCVILCQGIISQRLHKIVKYASNYYRENPDFFVAGHILTRKDRYPGLHRQTLIVNVRRWKDLDSPPFDEPGVFWDRKPEYSNYEVSEETVYSNYTPKWIKGAPGTQKVTFSDDGSNWIDICCRNNIAIKNLGHEVRDAKNFIYPYQETDKIKSVWYDLQNEDLIDSFKIVSQRTWFRKISFQDYIKKEIVFPFNTENMSNEGKRVDGDIDSVFSTASGFKVLKLLDVNGFHPNTKIIYYDWCNASLAFKKLLLETWDGKDFHLWLEKHDRDFVFSNGNKMDYEKFWRQEIKKEFCSEEHFRYLWDRYKKLHHEFVLIDIVNETDKFFEILNRYKGNTVLSLTNIWATLMLHWNLDIEEIKQRYYYFETNLPDNIVVYGVNHLSDSIRANRIIDNYKYISTHKYLQSEQSWNQE